METTDIKKLASEWNKLAEYSRKDFNEVRDQFLKATKEEINKVASVFNLDKLNAFVKTAQSKGHSEREINSFLDEKRILRFLR